MKIASSYIINIPKIQKTQIKTPVQNTFSAPQKPSLPVFCGNLPQISYSGGALLDQLISERADKKETPAEIKKVNEVASRYTEKDVEHPAALLKNGRLRDEVKFSADEREFFERFLEKHDYMDDYSEYSDKNLLLRSCRLVSDWEKYREECLADIKKSFEEPKNKEVLTEEELNSISSNFFDNVAPKLSIGELGDLKYIIYRAEGNAEKLKFDYSLFGKRRLSALFYDVNDRHNYPRIDLLSDFLYCSNDEFEEKIKRLSKRHTLRNCTLFGNPKISFDNWRILLNMGDEEYLEKTTPNAERVCHEIDSDLFKTQIKARAQKPIVYDNKAMQELIRSFNPRVVTNYHIPKTLYKFESLPQKEIKEVPLLEVPLVKSKLYNNEDISFSIPDVGGTCPTRAEEPVIHCKDYERLNKTQSAKKTIKYGAKINWSNKKIARDILQNFYDGNGHTLEGTDFDFKAGKDGKYTVTIKGLGNYDYEHIENTGSSTKDDDYESAGFYGEGTKVLAACLLSRPDTPSVEYGCGEWKMTLGRSSDNLQEALMTKTLDKNETPVEGNYIRFETKDKDLIKTLIEARDYFYHPSNPDFFNFDYENEFFGIRFLPKDEDGNLYLIQKYESTMPLKGVSIVFKKDPNDPELVKKNRGITCKMSDRDRSALDYGRIVNLFSRYIKTMSNEDISKLLCSMESVWNLDTAKSGGTTYFKSQFVNALIDEMRSRDIGIDFGSEYVLDDENEVTRDIMRNLGYKIGISKMSSVGMKPHEDSVKKPKNPDDIQTQKIRVLDEGLRVLQDNCDVSQMELIQEDEIDTPKYVFEDKDCPNISAEAIIDRSDFFGPRRYNGHWVKEGYLNYAPFETVLGTWLHELSHKVGGDESEIFSTQLIKIQEMLLDILINNKAALQKMTALKEMYDSVTIKNTPFDKDKFKAHLLQKLNKNDYSTGEYEEKLDTDENKYEKEYDFQYNWAEPSDKKPLKTLQDARDYMFELLQNGSVCVNIPNEGGANPVKNERAAINPNDTERLGKEESAYITVKYGAKINWSNEKIARDIMQNFFDGNGYTLEGVDIEVEQTNDGKYKVRIKGLGEYDYEHVENIGSSTKDDDANSAGFYGEGTGIVAVNLLSKLDVPYVEYASGDWKMTFGRTSDNIKEAVMTQTLNKNEERVNGNYVEFVTDDKSLVESIIQSKDYFYHPNNPDFQNLNFENEFFGFKLCPDKNGNLYYIQRYQDETGKMEKPLRDMSIVFKKAFSGASVGTGRDRMKIESNTLLSLACIYAQTMTDDELVQAICDLLPVYSNSVPNTHMEHTKDSVIYFVEGLVENAALRKIKINFDNQKIVADTKNHYTDSIASNHLYNTGYKFAPSFMTKVGMKTDDEVYKSLNLKKSAAPLEIEKKKLKILKEALAMLCPQAKDKDIYMQDTNSYFEHFTTIEDGLGIMIDRGFMKNANFIEILSGLLAQVHDKNNDKKFATYSYNLTDQIKYELAVLIQNPNTAQKLKAMEEVYNEIK